MYIIPHKFGLLSPHFVLVRSCAGGVPRAERPRSSLPDTPGRRLAMPVAHQTARNPLSPSHKKLSAFEALHILDFRLAFFDRKLINCSFFASIASP